jgi:anti-sigma regulatory factor (Ser/Thr protein kinase)
LFKGRGVLRMKDVLRAVGDRKEIRKEVHTSLVIGFSTSIRYIFQFLFLPLGNRLLLRAGDLGLIDGDLYVAVFDVVMNVSYVSSSVFQASSETMQPLASVFSEEHDRDSLKCVLRLALSWGLALGAALAGLLALFAGPVSSFFGVTEAASQAVSIPAIRIFCLSAPLGGCLIILMGYYQSVGENRLSRLITLMRSALFLLPIAFVFGMFYPAGFWWLFPACEAASLLLLGAVNRFRRRNALTADIPVFSAVMDNGDHELQRVLEGLERFCEEQEYPMKKAMQIQLAAEELCLVTLEKAFTGKPEEYIQVTLCEEKSGDFSLRIRNSAPYFNPLDMKMGRLQQDAKEEFLDSIGVMMVKKQAKALYYRNYEGFNVVLAVL